MKNIITIGPESKIDEFISKIWGKKPTFLCVIGNTETGKIPGISAAGANPEITDFTPAADVEYLYYGKCKCIDGVPVTPNGIPTPALITKAALKLLKCTYIPVVSGVNILPQTPYIYVQGKAGGNISLGKGVENPEIIFENAKILGEQISKSANYITIGESIAGGTTTALGVLIGLGYNAWGKVSSSLPENPQELKSKIVKEGLEKVSGKLGFFKEKPMDCVRHLGDPMQIAAAGIAIGAYKNCPILLAGGTQMTAVLALIKAIQADALNEIAIGTTKWILDDGQSNIKELVQKIDPNVPIFGACFDFSKMKFEGLRVYEQGIVKEGVGAGGIAIAALMHDHGEISIAKIQALVEEEYEKITVAPS